MKTKKKVVIALGIIVVIVGIILCLLGIIMEISQKKPLKDNDSKEVEDTSYKKLINNKEIMKKEHCLDKLCITNMINVYETYETVLFGTIRGDVTNKGRKTIPAGYIKITFKIGKKTKSVYYHCADLAPGATISMELQHNEQDIVKATDYIIEIPSASDVADYITGLPPTSEVAD